jgi:hypothetical protein
LTAVLLGFGDGFGSVRIGAAAGALPAGEREMTCDDDAPGAPRGAERVDAGLVGLSELGVGEGVGALLREAEVLD